jgi:hypothetical protein
MRCIKTNETTTEIESDEFAFSEEVERLDPFSCNWKESLPYLPIQRALGFDFLSMIHSSLGMFQNREEKNN